MLRYAITPGRLLPGHSQAPLLAALRALPPVDYLLLREKSLPPGELLTFAHAAREALSHTPTRILLPSRLDIALAAHLDGLHLTATPGELTPAQVRRLLPGAVISQSCHTLAAVQAARQARPDLILFAPVFGKQLPTGQIPSQGLAALAEAARHAAPVPVLALGGITRENTPSCLDAGAAGIAAIRLFFPSER